ncbi:unnamed protein product [Oppiella nova]|uniref:Uncharacterized protein n=1 Tax=Oppiella nova TaxID=334625 RepID=A0A7R9MBF2_9ACAR|nr:unnamed protein product [Oppiella nova]CAG2174225.1 unnamed protein product [Oppiella nova]
MSRSFQEVTRIGLKSLFFE